VTFVVVLVVVAVVFVVAEYASMQVSVNGNKVNVLLENTLSLEIGCEGAMVKIIRMQKMAITIISILFVFQLP